LLDWDNNLFSRLGTSLGRQSNNKGLLGYPRWCGHRSPSQFGVWSYRNISIGKSSWIIVILFDVITVRNLKLSQIITNFFKFDLLNIYLSISRLDGDKFNSGHITDFAFFSDSWTISAIFLLLFFAGCTSERLRNICKLWWIFILEIIIFWKDRWLDFHHLILRIFHRLRKLICLSFLISQIFNFWNYFDLSHLNLWLNLLRFIFFLFLINTLTNV
jgi:hypothetical protein